jgi:PAS domain S-box-containing protein
MITLVCRDLAAHLRSLEGSLFKAFLDELPDLIFVKDTDSRFLHSNKAHQLHLGMKEAQLLGKNDFEIYPSRFAEAFFADETRLFQNRVPVVKVERTQTHEGKGFLTVTVKQVVVGEHDEILGLMGVARRLGAHDALALAETREQIMDMLNHDVGPDVTPDQLRAMRMSFEAMFKSPP